MIIRVRTRGRSVNRTRLILFVAALGLLLGVLGLRAMAAGAALDREAITSYNTMTGGAPYWGFFNNAWQPFVAQSQYITHIGVTVGNPTLPAGVPVGYNVNLELCTSQPDINGNCPTVLAQASPQIINYGNSYADIGDVAVTPGQTYWAVWYQPPLAGGKTWVTYWWAGGPTIGQSSQMQMLVTGFTPSTPTGGWVAPAAGSTLSGAVQLEANVTSAEQVEFDAYYATDPADITTVGWHRIGMGTDAGSNNWTLAWNSASIPDQGNAGWGTVNVVAIPIVAGQLSGTRFYQLFNVDNGASGAPPSTSPPPTSAPPPPRAYGYAIANVVSVNLRAGPGTNFNSVGTLAGNTAIDIVCQTVGSDVNGSTVWDQLASGSYVSDWFTTTPVVGGYSPGLPRCSGAPAQVNPTAPAGQWSIVGSAVTLRAGPGTSYSATGSLGVSARFDITCQTYGTTVYGSPVWDRLPDGSYLPDYFTNTPIYGNFSPGIAVCAGTGARPGGAGGAGGGAAAGAGAGGVAAGPSSGCAGDILFIGARGTQEGNAGFGSTIQVTLDQLENRYQERLRLDSLDYVYPGGSFGELVFRPADYFGSVQEGTDAILSEIQDDVDSWNRHCSNKLHILIAGYSLGAWAVGNAVTDLQGSRYQAAITGVALFGDPLNPGGVYVHGIAGQRAPWPPYLAGKVRSYCRSADPICGWFPDPVHYAELAALAISGHAHYKDPGGEAEQAGVWMSDQIG